MGLHANTNDPQALRNYTERYEYDTAGNIDVLRHLSGSNGWTRRYTHQEPSLIQPATTSNRLSAPSLGNGVVSTETYTYLDTSGRDVDGCITGINDMAMSWDYKGQLQQVDLGGGGTAYYVYDASGQRIRKIIHRHNGTRHHERIYLGSYEIFPNTLAQPPTTDRAGARNPPRNGRSAPHCSG